MPIQIIDNFDLTSAKPIDNRIVVGTSSFYVNRDLISHKYPGLRIWDLNDSIPYVWTGATWSNENSSGAVTSQGGTAGYISKFVGGGSIIANSIMFESTSKIGINTLSPSETLDVSGTVKATLFKGSGFELTSLNGTNITTGTIAINRIQNGSSGQILIATVGSPQWANTSSITAGNATNVSLSNNTTSSGVWNIGFYSSTTGNLPTNVSGARLQYRPSSGQLLMFSGTSLLPSLSFVDDPNTGMYSSAPDEVSFSTGGSIRLKVNNTLVSVNSNFAVPVGSATAPSFYFLGSNTGLYRPGANQFGITINSSRALEINTSGTVKNFDFYSQDTTNHLNIAVKNNGEMTFHNSLSTSYYSFIINSQSLVKINSDGVSMLRPMVASTTTGVRWSVTSIAADDRYLSDLAGTTSASPTWLASTTYDRIFSGFMDGATNTGHLTVFIEDMGGVAIKQYRSTYGQYPGVVGFIPAGRRFQIFYVMTSVSGSVSLNCFITRLGL